MLERCPWYIAGPLLGVLMVGLRAALNRPFGALGGYVDLAQGVTNRRQLGFRAYLLIGLALGGALFAVAFGARAPSFEYSGYGLQIAETAGAQWLLLFAAGAVMGFGARMAGGCTSGHGLSGMCIGSPASVLASMTFFATAVAAAHVLYRIAGVP